MNILVYVVLIPIAFNHTLPASPYEVPPNGTYPVGTQMEITTSMLCDWIAVDPFVENYRVVQGDPGHVFLYITEATTVTAILLTCYDLRWNYTQYIISVEWEFYDGQVFIPQ